MPVSDSNGECDGVVEHIVAGFFVVGSRNNFNACCGNLGMIFRRILACACVGAEEVQGVDVAESGLPGTQVYP